MDIVIVAQYLRDIEKFEENNSRFVYLAKMLRYKQHNVEIITSDFHHGLKVHFLSFGKLEDIVVTAIHEPGYPKNVSLKRFFSHRVLAKNIKVYLEKRNKPDVIYSAVPSLAVAEVCADYCKNKGIKFVLDIQDLWPEAFRMVLNIPVLSDMLFFSMQKQANRIYAAADEIVAVSETYAKRCVGVNKKCNEPTIVYLGTEKESFDKYTRKVDRCTDDIIVTYIGSLAASYDLEIVIDAIAHINKPVKFLVMGDGDYKDRIKKYSQQKGINIEFAGKLEYPKMVERLVNSDIAVNPIHKGSAGSVINKVNDYAMAGLPVINSQENDEYRSLINEYQAGINCACEDVNDFTVALKKLCDDSELRKTMGLGNRKLAEVKFDRNETYKKIVCIIER